MGKLGWFMSKIDNNIPTTWRWAHRDSKVKGAYCYCSIRDTNSSACTGTVVCFQTKLNNFFSTGRVLGFPRAKAHKMIRKGRFTRFANCKRSFCLSINVALLINSTSFFSLNPRVSEQWIWLLFVIWSILLCSNMIFVIYIYILHILSLQVEWQCWILSFHVKVSTLQAAL